MTRYAYTNQYALGMGLLGFYTTSYVQPGDGIAMVVMTVFWMLFGAAAGFIRDHYRTKRHGQAHTDRQPLRPYWVWWGGGLGVLLGLFHGSNTKEQAIQLMVVNITFFALVGLCWDLSRKNAAETRKAQGAE